MSNHELLQMIIERVANNVPTKGAFFYWDEVKNWPNNQLYFFENIGLLKPAQHMTEIVCDGCEENCIMPVTINPISETSPARAFVTCDKRDEIGRVKVDFDRLKQWQLTELQLTQFVAGLFEFTQQPSKDAGFWRLGMLQGKSHKAPTLLGFENSQAIIKVAGHQVNLIELLLIENDKCRIDLKKLKTFVDNPTGLADDKEASEARQDRLLTRKRELKSQGVTNFNQQIAIEERMSLANVKKLIKAAEDREKFLKSNKYGQLIHNRQ